MGLPDISRSEILAAAGEYDGLGQDEFLRKYGFDRARSYLLIHNGKAYGSKAMRTAAHRGSKAGKQPSRASGNCLSATAHAENVRAPTIRLRLCTTLGCGSCKLVALRCPRPTVMPSLSAGLTSTPPAGGLVMRKSEKRMTALPRVAHLRRPTGGCAASPIRPERETTGSGSPEKRTS